MNADLLFFAACALWVAIALTFFFATNFARQKKKKSSSVLFVQDDVFGESQAVRFFLPAADKDSEEMVEIDADSFEVKYEDSDIGLDFSRYPSDAFVETESKDDTPVQGMLFDDIRKAVQAVQMVKSREAINTLSADTLQQTRRTFRMLDESDLLEKMRNMIPEMNARMEAFMDREQ
jgi:hypothetical protein